MTVTKSDPEPAADTFQIGPGMWVRLRYEVFDEEGERAESTAQEMAYVHGRGVLLPGLEAALDGRRADSSFSVTLRPEDAFGRRRKEAILELDRDELPPDVVAGDRFEAESENGALLVLRVLEVHPDAVVVDTNHPLAGQRVRFELSVLEVRPATPEELAAAEQALSDRPAGEPLIPVESLLRGPSQRYEMGRAGPGNARTTPADDET